MTPKEFKIQLHNEIAVALISTKKSYDVIKAEFGVSTVTISKIAKSRNIKRKIGRPKKQVV